MPLMSQFTLIRNIVFPNVLLFLTSFLPESLLSSQSRESNASKKRYAITNNGVNNEEKQNKTKQNKTGYISEENQTNTKIIFIWSKYQIWMNL